MTLGPEYEDQGKTWRDVTSPDLKAPKPQGTQYHADGEWLDIAVNGSKFYAGHTYRIPAIAPQTATEAPAPVPPALPMTLVPTSPQPPCGSVVLVGRYPQAYQRFDRGWCPTGGTVVHSWHRLTRDNDPVILIYVPPEPAL